MITIGCKTFYFFGCDVKPDALKKGATTQLRQLCDEIEHIAEADAFNNKNDIRDQITNILHSDNQQVTNLAAPAVN